MPKVGTPVLVEEEKHNIERDIISAQLAFQLNLLLCRSHVLYVSSPVIPCLEGIRNSDGNLAACNEWSQMSKVEAIIHIFRLPCASRRREIELEFAS